MGDNVGNAPRFWFRIFMVFCISSSGIVASHYVMREKFRTRKYPIVSMRSEFRIKEKKTRKCYATSTYIPYCQSFKIFSSHFLKIYWQHLIIKSSDG